MSRVFISHSHRDHSFAERLAHDLAIRGVDVWYSEWEMKPGDSLIRKVAEGIVSSGVMIVLLSENSVNSEWVEKELALAMRDSLAKMGVRILPVLIEDCTFPRSFHFLGDTIYADFRVDYEAGLKRLLPPLGMRSSKRGIRSYTGPRNAIDATAPGAVQYCRMEGTEEVWEYDRLAESIELRLKDGNRVTELPVLEIPLTKSESSKVRRMHRNDGWAYFTLTQPQGPYRGVIRVDFRDFEMEPITLTWFLDKRRCRTIVHTYNDFVGEDIYELPPD